jgi:nucleotide-binding universal stress UspA family protein
MQTILVPTDFSALSKVAVMYAARLAVQLKAKIFLVSVVNVNTTSQTLMKWQKLEEEMLEIAQQDADKLIDEIRTQVGGELNIRYQSVKGFPIELVLERFIGEHKIDLIVMGTKGVTGLKKTLLGSNATAVIDHSSIPVVAVPGDAKFNNVKRIIYATDLESVHEEIQTIAVYARKLGAEISILHVLPTDSTKTIDTKEITKQLIAETKYKAISFDVMHNDDISEAVEEFFQAQHGDMLAMFTHKLHFFEKLFGRSVTQQMAFHAEVPLLTFNKTMLIA